MSASLLPGWARATGPAAALSGDRIDLSIGHLPVSVTGRSGHAFAVNGSVPAPLIRLREGQNVRIAVTNTLDESSSIHWHGLLVPFQHDGVPGVSFPGIAPGETYVYDFPVRQAGTYWYHSHSNMQEAMGQYGPIVIDPAAADPVAFDREHVIMLADWSFLHPHQILAKLKQQPGYFNRRRMTMTSGDAMPLAMRMEWARMRMDPTDLSDVTGATYTYLVNGCDPATNWTALFSPGERVRLRIINASAMTNFNVRIPGIPLTVVQADGLDVQPVTVDEFQIAVAETFDVVVTPQEDRAYTLFAEASDSSGFARATLAPREGMAAPIPSLRRRKPLAMRDMGMDHGATGHDKAAHDGAHDGGTDHGAMPDMDHGAAPPSNGAMAAMDMSMRNPANAPEVRLGPGVQMIAPMPADRTHERGQGLEEAEGRVLVYADLIALAENPDPRPPARTLDIHLTANMERYMWSFDGVKYSDGADPIPFRLNERVRVTLINDTMMAHPIHLHGHFFDVVTGSDPRRRPRKHTVNVLPGGKVTFDLTADGEGDWAFHCHMLYHMHAGMFRVVTVRRDAGAA